MEVSKHAKAKWMVRADFRESVVDAWSEGVRVSMPGYSYTEARFDSKSNMVLLSHGDEIVTVIKCYEHIEIKPLGKVSCLECDWDFQGRKTCPKCGSESWE